MQAGPLVVARHLTKRFDSFVAVAGIDFDVAANSPRSTKGSRSFEP